MRMDVDVTIVPRFADGEILTAGQLNRLSEALERSMQCQAVQHAELPMAATVATAGLLLAGSSRQVSRRGFLGLRWFSRK